MQRRIAEKETAAVTLDIQIQSLKQQLTNAERQQNNEAKLRTEVEQLRLQNLRSETQSANQSQRNATLEREISMLQAQIRNAEQERKQMDIRRQAEQFRSSLFPTAATPLNGPMNGVGGNTVPQLVTGQPVPSLHQSVVPSSTYAVVTSPLPSWMGK